MTTPPPPIIWLLFEVYFTCSMPLKHEHVPFQGISQCSSLIHCFLHNGNYEQMNDVAMGSPLSPVTLDFYMASFKHQVLASKEQNPPCFLLYVNDTSVVWSHGLDSCMSSWNFLMGYIRIVSLLWN